MLCGSGHAGRHAAISPQSLGQSEESGLQIGVGMNSGEVVVRSIDNDLNIDYSALGHTTHLAARMQELAGPGDILISASHCAKSKDLFTLSPSVPYSEGCLAAVEVYSVIGATTGAYTCAGGRGSWVDASGRTQRGNRYFQQPRRASSGGARTDPGDGRRTWSGKIAPGPRIYSSPAAGRVGSFSRRVGFLRQGNTLFSDCRDVASLLSNRSMATNCRKFEKRVVAHLLELDSTLKDTIPPILSLLGALPGKKTHSTNMVTANAARRYRRGNQPL